MKKSQLHIDDVLDDQEMESRIHLILQMEEILLKQKITYLQDVTDPVSTSEYEQGVSSYQESSIRLDVP